MVLPRNALIRGMERAEILELVLTVAQRSPCLEDKVGAVIYHPPTKVAVLGWNHVSGAPDCACELPTGQPHPNLLHAERAALEAAEYALEPRQVKESLLFVSRRPCKQCALQLSYQQIKAVFYQYPQPCMASVAHLKRRGVIVGQWEQDAALIDKLLCGENP